MWKLRQKKPIGLRPPTYTDRKATVENVYPNNGRDRDRTSQRRMAEYLKDRLLPRAMGSRAVEVVVHDGYISKSKWGRDGWLISPKQAIVGTVLAMGAINGIVNSDVIADNLKSVRADVVEEVDQLGFWWKHGEGTPDKMVSELSNEWVVTKHSTIIARTNHYVGTVGDTATQADRVVQGIVHDPNYVKGESTVTITARAGHGASDELRNNPSIGRKNPENEVLAKERLINDIQSLNEEFRAQGINVTITVEDGSREEVLSPADKDRLEKLAREAGYDGLYDAVVMADKLEAGPLKEAITNQFTLARGTVFDIEIDTTKVTERPGSDYKIPGINPPLNPEHPYGGFEIFPLLVPPVPRLRRYKELIEEMRAYRFEEEHGDPVWIRLFKDAMTDDGDLQRDLAFYTRKLNHLLRDDRIKHVECANVIGHDDGVEREMRLCFVDVQPNEEVLARYRKVLSTALRCNEGILPDAISTIMVYPSESAGVEHGNPKRIGLGIDTQDPEEVLGVTMPLLGLIELHAPSEPSEAYMESFEGALWTLAHELGHGADVDATKPQELVHIADNMYVARNSWRDVGADLYERLAILTGNEIAEGRELYFEITRRVMDKRGIVQDITEVVSHRDPRLKEAVVARLLDYQPTGYSGEDSLETTAEGFAQVATGIEVPYDEAGLEVRDSGEFDHAKGYWVNDELRELIKSEFGITELDRGLAHSRVSFTSYGDVSEDPYLATLANKARHRVTPPEEDMLEVLTWVIGRNYQEPSNV